MKRAREIAKLQKIIAVLLLLPLLGLDCDKSYNPTVGPLRLPMANPPTHVLKIGGVQSIFPILWQLDLSRPANLPAADIIFFATQQMPSAEQLQKLRPMPLDSLREAGFNVSPIGEVEGYGRFAGYAQWAENEIQITCVVPDIPVFAEGGLLYAIAEPLPPWLDVTLHFNRIRAPDPPDVTVMPLNPME